MPLWRAQYLIRIKPTLKTCLLATPRRLHTPTSTVYRSRWTRPCANSRATLTISTPWHQVSQHRGAKRKATLIIDDMPQGPIETSALPPQDDVEPEYPPLLQQVRNNMLKFSHCVILTRVGGFYEVCGLSAACALLTLVAVFRAR